MCRGIVLLVFCGLITVTTAILTKDSIAVEGTLFCNEYYSTNTVVQLWDQNTVGKDDLLTEITGERYGQFQLQGVQKTRWGAFHPKLTIIHTCNVSRPGCVRKFDIIIQEKYVTEGKIPKKTFYAGRIELALNRTTETIDC